MDRACLIIVEKEHADRLFWCAGQIRIVEQEMQRIVQFIVLDAGVGFASYPYLLLVVPVVQTVKIFQQYLPHVRIHQSGLFQVFHFSYSLRGMCDNSGFALTLPVPGNGRPSRPSTRPLERTTT